MGLGWLASESAHAQTTCAANCVLTVGQSFTLVADADPVNTTGYRIYMDGVKQGVDLPLSALQAGSITVAAIVAPARGSHTLIVSAFNPDVESKSDPFTFTTIMAPPKKPGNLRLLFTVILAEDGTIQFKFLGIDAFTDGVLAGASSAGR
jgi:hypothetical protein